jgi:hypothetical protein
MALEKILQGGSIDCSILCTHYSSTISTSPSTGSALASARAVPVEGLVMEKYFSMTSPLT